VNLDAYLRRIDYTGELTPTAGTLAALHLAHATHIPFENLDILLGRSIRLAAEDLERKLVADRRGGYCFEQNLLFSRVLEQVGFTVTRLIGRVRYRTAAVLPRTHMMLLVEAEGGHWIADVGFGAEGLLLPVPFGDGAESRQFLWTYRVVPESETGAAVPRPGVWVMQSLRDDGWIDMYALTLEPQELIDFEVANHYTSTHPSSRFMQTLAVQLAGPEARLLLRNRELTIDRGASSSTRMLEDQDEVLRVLAESFGLVFPAGTRFRFTETP
jgi:N-hydroxyarylamine O-acetyltransferase